MNTINIIIILLLLIPIIYIVYNYYQKQNTNTNSNNACQGDQCIKTIKCGVLSSNTIKKCDDNSSICESCQCTSDPNVRQNCMSCTKVDQNNKYNVNISEDNCKDPFQWDKTVNKCYLKDGSYCLPQKMIDITCNPYTSDKLLTLNGNVYEWKCICKNPFKFDGDTCSNIKVCGLNDGTTNPINPNNPKLSRALIRKDSSPSDYWNINSTWDPFKDSICLCKEHEEYDEKTQSCLPTRCEPGTQKTDKICDCPTGYISCDKINLSNGQEKGICYMPSCVPDPCGVNGKLGNSDLCECNENYYDLIDPNSVIGHSCQNPCITNNPCGDRGDCFIWDETNDNITWTISCNNNDQLCSGKYLFETENGDYLQSDFTLQKSGPYFNIEGDDGSLITEIKNGESYYIKDSSGNYLDFINKTSSKDKPKDNKSIVINFIEKNQTESKYQLMNINNFYISGNLSSDGRINTNSQSWLGTARCKDCKNGNFQDPQNFCNQTDPGSCACYGKGLGCVAPRESNNCKNGFTPNCSFVNWKLICECTCERNI